MNANAGTDGERSLLPDSKTIEILHIEDDPAFAELVATFLERERRTFDVRTETSPDAALATIRDAETDLDCIVSDYDLTEQNGLDVLHRVRAEDPDLPFILFTGKGSEEIASEAITAGVTDYLQKGGGTDQYQVLANRIQNAVERYWAERYMNRGLQAIETAQEGISILDEDGTIQYLNTASAEMLGYERDELVGVHWERLYRDDDVDRVYDELLPSARQSRWQGRTTLLRKDGSLVDVDHTLASTDDGSLICTLSGPAEDGSDARELFSKERAMDEAPVGIVLTDPDADDNPIVYANDRFTELTGYERDEVIGRNCRFLQGAATSEEAVATIRAAVDDREPVTVELRNYRADGTEFWNRVRIAPIFDGDGEVAFFVGFQDDVTERRETEERLRTTTARLEAFFEHSPDMVAIHDADGTIRDVNQRMCDELGYAESELVGKSVWDVDPTVDPDRARSFWAGLSTNTRRRFEGELQRKDGTTFPIEVHLLRLDLAGEERFVAMDRDISDQKSREEELVRQNEQLDRFTSVVSHDLRNPLQVAMGRLALLRDECDSDHIDDIEGALDRMDALIDDLLTLAHGGDGAMDVEPVDIGALARTAWETVETDRATLAVEADVTVAADRDRLQQLFENLFRNAVEHGSTSSRRSADGAVEHGSTSDRAESGNAAEPGSAGGRESDGDVADVTVTVGGTESGFYVADDGPGVPESKRDEVFEAGYSTASDGTGFGLNIVAQVVEAHGWRVDLTESADGGARFEVSVPEDGGRR